MTKMLKAINLRRIFYIAIGMLLISLLYTNCIPQEDDALYTFWADHEADNGYPFHIRRPDSCFIDTTRVRGAKYNVFSSDNLFGVGDTLTTSSVESAMFPVYVHRFSGQTDTLHLKYFFSGYNLYLGVIRSYYEDDNWLILAVAFPGDVLANSFLVDTAYLNKKEKYIPLNAYSYDGQKRFFASREFHYWIINRSTTDWYGLLTEKELRPQIQRLGIPLPLTLKNACTPYVLPRMVNGNFADIPWPKHFLFWPSDDKLKDKIIGETY